MALAAIAVALLLIDGGAAASVPSSDLSLIGSGSASGGALKGRILLDSAILYWVLLPICMVMVMQGILRQYVSILLRDDKRPGASRLGPSKSSLLEQTANALLLRRSARLRSTAKYLNSASFKMRKKYLSSAFEEAPKPEEADANDPAAAMGGGDPMAMMGMMKQNMLMVVPNMILMGWVSYFFSGFVLVKLPFGLSDRFKQLTQRGILIK
jgi:hypothetical protein